MFRFAALASFAALAVFAPDCSGEEAPPLARTIAPYVDGQTLAVLHADLVGFDAAGAVDMLANFLHLSPEDRDGAQARVVPLSVLAGSLPEGATADVFAVVSISDLAGLPLFFVLPLEPGTPAAAVSVELKRNIALRTGSELTTRQIGSALVTGTPRTIERLKKAMPAERSEIAAAFEAVEGSAVQLLIVPTADARRAAELLFPMLPPELGGAPTRQLTQSVTWVALGLDFPAEIAQVRVVVQTASDAAARSLADGLTALLTSLGQKEQVRRAIPHFDDLAKRLAPQVAGKRITLELAAEQEEMASLGTLVQPVFKSFAAMAARRQAPARKPPDR
jgi:hypothetical protein